MPSTFLSTPVTIYATKPEMVAPIRALVEDYAPHLPRFASFTMLDAPDDSQPEEGQ